MSVTPTPVDLCVEPWTRLNPSTVGESCRDCGHAAALHPGPTNPSLDACLACHVVVNVAKLAELTAAVLAERRPV
jgi:hypothetical protein